MTKKTADELMAILADPDDVAKSRLLAKAIRERDHEAVQAGVKEMTTGYFAKINEAAVEAVLNDDVAAAAMLLTVSSSFGEMLVDAVSMSVTEEDSERVAELSLRMDELRRRS